MTTSAPDERGFSYFMGLGRQHVTYRERPSILPVRMKSELSSPLLITGALYAIDADNLMSLDSETTFAPGSATERWTATAMSIDTGSGTINLTDPLLQTNRFSLQQTSTRLLWQGRLQRSLFLVAGPSFHSYSFRRFDFVPGPDNAVTAFAGTVEESVSEMLVNVGLALESENVRNARTHYGVRVGLATPLWRRVENTAFPGMTFSKRDGYDLSVSGRFSVALHPKIHLGAWGQLVRGQRGNQVIGNAELPESELNTLSYGVELLWKL